ncbi:MAG TPA: DUF4928 family protein [Ktedonobacteraceae bacterium]|nr:DUF4928 family protein [Ktedonobacteraceae bacterium]
MSIREDLQRNVAIIYQEWYAGIDKNDQREGWGALCGGITILENLMGDYVLDLPYHQTESGTQIKKAGPTLGRKVFRKFGISVNARLGEFGRTSRGGPPAAARLMALLGRLHLENLPVEERNEALLLLQRLITFDLLKLLERRTQLIRTGSTDTFEKTLKDLLAAVPPISSGAVAQHLVGAKLKLRFPNREISNDVTAAADAPTKRPGDFIIEDTSIHITLSPQDAVFEKCIENLNEKLKVYLLVPEHKVSLAKRKAAQHNLEHQITIKSIESFIAQNIDEIAEFSKEDFTLQKENLIRIYNERIQGANERYAPYLSLSEEGIEVEEQINEDEEANGNSSDAHNIYRTNSLFDLPIEDD